MATETTIFIGFFPSTVFLRILGAASTRFLGVDRGKRTTERLLSYICPREFLYRKSERVPLEANAMAMRNILTFCYFRKAFEHYYFVTCTETIVISVGITKGADLKEDCFGSGIPERQFARRRNGLKHKFLNIRARTRNIETDGNVKLAMSRYFKPCAIGCPGYNAKRNARFDP